jgi:hypothetical protein
MPKIACPALSSGSPGSDSEFNFGASGRTVFAAPEPRSLTALAPHVPAQREGSRFTVGAAFRQQPQPWPFRSPVTPSVPASGAPAQSLQATTGQTRLHPVTGIIARWDRGTSLTAAFLAIRAPKCARSAASLTGFSRIVVPAANGTGKNSGDPVSMITGTPCTLSRVTSMLDCSPPRRWKSTRATSGKC